MGTGECTSTASTQRFDWPRAIFLTFFLLEPRGVVRFALGAAFLRAVRLSFLRSALSVTFFVSATEKSSFYQCVRDHAQVPW